MAAPGELGEFALIEQVRRRLGAVGQSRRLVVGSGDDAAVTLPGGATATSIDSIVEAVHFRLETSDPAEIGHKALATALSDLAAMGAEPGEAYVALGLPDRLDAAAALALCDGLLALAARSGVALAGGDISASELLFVTVAVVGHADRAEDFVTRSGARPGDRVLASGAFGGAAAGLAWLERERGEAAINRGDPGLAAAVSEVIRRQRRPEPLLALGRALAPEVSAMIDISDGLGADLGHIGAASSVAIELEAGRIPVDPAARRVASELELDPEALALGGGEDYELAVTVDPPRSAAAVAAAAACGVELTEIGRVAAGGGVSLGGLSLPRTGGFEHRRGR